MTKTQYWLLQHMITAFWHTFGISNGLLIPIEETKKYKFKNDSQYYVEASPKFMQWRLKDYIKWLKKYEKSWNTKNFENSPIKNDTEFLADEKSHLSRKDIYEMIKLLQLN